MITPMAARNIIKHRKRQWRHSPDTSTTSASMSGIPSLSSPRSAPRAESSVGTLRGALKDFHLAEACPPPHLSYFGLVVLLLLLFLFILAGMVFAEAGEFTAWGRVGDFLGRSGSFANLPRCNLVIKYLKIGRERIMYVVPERSNSPSR